MAYAEVVRRNVAASQTGLYVELQLIDGFGSASRSGNQWGSSRIAFIPFCTLGSSTKLSPEWMMSMIALGRIASRFLRKTRAWPRYAVRLQSATWSSIREDGPSGAYMHSVEK